MEQSITSRFSWRRGKSQCSMVHGIVLLIFIQQRMIENTVGCKSEERCDALQ